MSYTNSEKWKTVKVPRGLSERIDEFVKSQEAYHLGLTSNSQVVAHAIRQFLEDGNDIEIRKIKSKIQNTMSEIDQSESSEHEPIQ